MIICECEVTRLESSAVFEPYDEDVPYITCEIAPSFVGHVIVAVLVVTDELSDEITGGVTSAVPLAEVVNVMSAEVTSILETCERTWK